MTIDGETVGIPEVLPEGSVGRATGLAFRFESYRSSHEEKVDSKHSIS